MFINARTALKAVLLIFALIVTALRRDGIID